MGRSGYVRTLRDMARDQSVLDLRCLGCARRKVVYLLGLIERYGPDKPIRDLRFKCTICGGNADVRETIR
jgi:hypothetical protein